MWLPSICPSNEIPSAREERATASAQLALEVLNEGGIELRSSLWCGGKPHEAVHVRADTHQMVAMVETRGTIDARAVFFIIGACSRYNAD